jgi:hypothetical protein
MLGFLKILKCLGGLFAITAVYIFIKEVDILLDRR